MVRRKAPCADATLAIREPRITGQAPGASFSTVTGIKIPQIHQKMPD
jgi:hypothetical protein